MSKAIKDQPKILSENLFPVVGIGASAGGLEAFKKFIKEIQPHSGMAYILVQHLHPQHDSALPEILQRVTKVPVLEISDNVKVQPDHIYVIPSNKMLIATDGILKLSPRDSKDGLNLPIDLFFSSLAQVHQAHAIGVILTGNGSDGTAGLKDIKDNGGLTIAEDPDSASYTSMPQHAIDAEIIDFVLPTEKIPAKLLELKDSFEISTLTDDPNTKDKAIEDIFRQIISLLKVRVGVDFNFYKQTTVRRRIIRRMVLLQLESIGDYLAHLKKNKPEQDILFHDLLIPVTSFFRDPKTFDSLCQTVFPEIVKNNSESKPLRIWVAGCSTGQEAYSVAICCHEYLTDHNINVKVQIFATDLSERSIKKARTGIYSKKEIEGISENRLLQFFDKTDGHYQIKKQIRNMCVFAVHNFLKDPPFAKMNLVTCRNVLIYFEPSLQKKAITIFHYSLNEKGTLLLGKSEATGSASDLFIPFGNKEKLYTRKSVPGKFTHMVSGGREMMPTNNAAAVKNTEAGKDDFQKSADDILLSKYTPAAVVVNEQFDIVQFRGLTGSYLEPAPGKASLNVLKMAKEGLAFEIRNALHKAKTSTEPAIIEDIPFNKGKKLVTIEVVPLLYTTDPHFLILFRDLLNGDHEQPLTSATKKGNVSKILKDQKDKHIQQLEKELERVKKDMLSITEDQEAFNEELQSSNEELLSGSEELQSLNEELESSKEELQSINEELITVNQELFDSNEELNKSRKFAEATIIILHEPLLVLHKNFIIKSANKSFYKIFGLTENETLGKNFFSLQDNGWDIPGLRKELDKFQHEKDKVIETEIMFTFPTVGERSICFNIQSINGTAGEQLILLALDDITSRKKAELILKEKANELFKEHQLLHNFLMESPALFTILKGPEHIFEFANSLFFLSTGNRNLLGKKIIDSMPELVGQGFIDILDKVYSTGESFVGKEVPISIDTGKEKPSPYFINFNCKSIRDAHGKIEGILVFAYNVSEQVMSRKKLERNAEMIYNLYMNAPAFMCTMTGPTHIYDLVNPAYQKIFGKRPLIGKPLMEALPEIEGQGFDKILDNVYKSGEIYVGVEVPIMMGRDEGLLPELGYFNLSYQPIYNEHKKITGILVFGYEVTKEILGRKIEEESAARFHQLADAMPQKMWIADAEGYVNYLNKQWFEFTHKLFEELEGLGWEKIIHPDDWNKNKQAWLNAINSGEDFQLEHRFLCYDGTYRWHLSRGLTQKDENGKVTVWLGTHTDIEEQKKKEQQKDEFISIASHEMKTPLTTAKGYLQLLELSLDKKDDEVNTYAKKASESVNRLNELINELLDSSKLKFGKLDYNITSFNFNDMISNAVDDIQHASQLHTIIKTGSITNLVTGDKNRLQQVVINLLTNAIKYSPNGKEVYINLQQKNDEIILSVKDNGIGISKPNLEKIFNKYFRVEEHAVKFQGLGIGLFISHEIIERHNGKLWAESKPGEGSTFYFTLPLSKN